MNTISTSASSDRLMGSSYPVMEHFYTLQGEGAHSGKAAYFIRLAGCDVGCVWCDVKESWDATMHPQIEIEHLVQTAAQHPARRIVITGGEPALHDLKPLTKALHKEGFQVHIETSGVHEMDQDLDWITLSPKKFKLPLKENLLRADELKVVIYHRSDFEFAEQYALQVASSCHLFLQPEWDRRETMTPRIIEYIQKNPQWQLSLQTHKYLNIP